MASGASGKGGLKRAIRGLVDPIYRFASSPRIRYSLPIEGARRFLSYDTREVMMAKIMEWARFRNLNGDYMEFGVFKGDSFTKAYHFAKYADLWSMRFYAFDSFSGYPPLEGVDKECGFFKEGDYANDLDAFKKNLRRGGVDLNEVVVVPGVFGDLKKTAAGIESKLASVVWIDCDIYKATLQALDFLVDYVGDGTIVVLADWYTCNGRPDMGQPRAVSEWLEKNPGLELIEYLNFGSRAFLVSRK